ncbi:MAG: hypothetical protein HY223_03255 [Thaumarchaeota archaeon]|nr:hypothetical protein [Nitrososphaerota archaeon]
MNIYDTKQISCYKCGRCIGEIDYDAIIINPKCGLCANPLPENDDKLTYLKNKFENVNENVIVVEN